MLLDELLDARVFDTPPTREELAALFERDARHGAADGRRSGARRDSRVSAHGDVPNRASRIGLGSLPLMKVSDRLTDTAELVLEFALQTAWRELAAKHGTPLCGPPPREAGFAVIGYGKLGGLELGYGSDLDLVFLHDSTGAQQETDGSPPLDNERFFSASRAAAHSLPLDSDELGPPVRSRHAPAAERPIRAARHEPRGFRRYQTQRGVGLGAPGVAAQPRARGLAPRLRARSRRMRREMLVAHVDRAKLKSEVAQDARRMRAELSLAKRGGFDLKQDPGGIADIEFLVDYWVLANSAEFPELVEFPDNIRQLEALERVGLVPTERCRRMKEAYLALRQRVHELALDEAGRVVARARVQRAARLGRQRSLGRGICRSGRRRR